MATGVLIAPDRGAANLVDDALDKARAANDAGVSQLWLGQQLDYDAIGLAALIGAAIPKIAVGTSVVPINPRHPLIVAAARANGPSDDSRQVQSRPGHLGCRSSKRLSSASRRAKRCNDCANISVGV
jgi:Luciferase-like monooxygenase